MKRTLMALLGLLGIVLLGCNLAFSSDLLAQARSALAAIEVVAGTYGANCRAPYANKTPHLAQTCNGRTTCTYTIDYQVIGDPAVGCGKDYVAEWRCGGNPEIHRASASPEAGFRKTVELSCAGVAAAPGPPGANLALRKPATQSSTGWGGDPGRAVDGNTDGNYFGGNSVSHTNSQPQEWWQVDLGAVYPIQTVRIWNRTDCCAERLNRFYVFVSERPLPAGGVQVAQQQSGVWSYFFDRTAGRTTEIPVHRNGRYVRVQLAGANYLQLAEVEVFGSGAVGGPPAPPLGGPVTGRVTLVTAASGQDFVGPSESLQRNGRNDVQFRLAVSAAGRTLTGLELRNTDGQFSVWDTFPGNGMWLMAVTQGGWLLNDAQGRLSPTPLPPSGEAVLDLYVEDNGSVAGGRTQYQLTLVFQDGSRQVLPVGLAAGGAGAPPSVCAQETRVYTNGNIAAVQNGPTQPTRFTLSQSTLVSYLMTYHWNSARGQTPGSIALRHQDGTLYGPWQASGAPGQGGVPNAYWIVRPDVVLKPGLYTFEDSNPATWAQNAQSQGQGMVEVRGCAGVAGLPPPPGGRDYTAIPIQPPRACDVAGTWRHGGGGETWTFTPLGGGRYAAQEKGFGNARGQAVLTGNRLRIDYTTQDGRITGFYEFTIAPDCMRGDGRWQDSQPAGGSASMVRVGPPAPGGPVTGQVNLVTVTSPQDYVGPNESLQRSGRNDVQFRLAVSGLGRILTGLELRNTDGQFSVWDTFPGNGMWLMAVTQGGRLLNDGQGRLSPTPLPPSGEAVLDLYVEDNGSVAGGRTNYQLTLVFQDGTRQVLPVTLTGAAPPPPTPPSGGITWDFETGDLRGWTKTGTAFDFQPTYGDNPTARQRGQPSHHQGSYWIGGYEKRPRLSDPAGQVQGDGPQGTLTSATFPIGRPSISFLLGGGCDINTERVELLVDGQVVLQTTGKCTETMERVRIDVSRHIGRTGQLRLVDTSGGGWGHINFDDVRFE